MIHHCSFFNILRCLEDYILDKCCTFNVSSSENKDFIIIVIIIIIISFLEGDHNDNKTETNTGTWETQNAS